MGVGKRAVLEDSLPFKLQAEKQAGGHGTRGLGGWTHGAIGRAAISGAVSQ